MSDDISSTLLSLLALHGDDSGGVSTRELGKMADISVYQALYYLRELQKQGRVTMVCGGGRGRIIYWRRVK
ncbi:TPA: FaeA/PapI family transcriptional regulator [Salmonella enterica subsp. enterica serovar Virchow]